jgi:hypothetical protein
MQSVQTLQGQNATAQTATPILRVNHPDLDALDMAVLMMMQFESSVPTPTDMAQALLAALYIAPDAMEALSETYPLSSLADITAAINAVYPLTPQAAAQYLASRNIAAQMAAPFIYRSFTSQMGGNAAGMISLLQANFQSSTKTMTQVTWALAEAGYSSTDAMSAMNMAYPGQLTDITAAIKAAYPAPSVIQDVQTLKNQGQTAQTAAPQLHTDHADLDALDMAVLLRLYFLGDVLTATDMARALKAASYSDTDATSALSETYPLNSLADIAAAINTVYVQNQ